MDEERLLSYHRFTREHGVNRPLYVLARALLQPFFLVYFRLTRIGREHGRVSGPLIVAANHRSFLDPFVIGASPALAPPAPLRRQGRAVREALAGLDPQPPRRVPGAPRAVRRGDPDHLARACSSAAARSASSPRGPGTGPARSRRPKRGFGRLALETGAAVLPVAVHGTEQVRHGWRIRPKKVKLRMGRALTFPRTEDPSPALANSVGARIWPVIELQWEWLGGLPPLRKAAVIGAGSWGTAVAVLLARGGLEVQLGTRTPERARGDGARRGRTSATCPACSSPTSLTVKRAAEIELAGIDLVCLAVPSAALPQAVGAIGDRVGQRTAVLLLSKGLVAPMAALPSEYVAERIRARAIASLGGPAHAKEAVSGTAALVLGSHDADLRDQLGGVFDEAGLVCERSEDMIGVEVAGAAKNAAALAGAAAERQRHERCRDRHRPGLARVRRRTPVRAGPTARPSAGLAGVGDLTATILARGQPQPPGRASCSARAHRRSRSRGSSGRRLRRSTPSR